MATKKNLEKEYKHYLNVATTELHEVYPSGYSAEKGRALKQCKEWCAEMNGERFRIVSHNGWAFTAGWTYVDKETGKKMFRYETAKNSYIWEIPEREEN